MSAGPTTDYPADGTSSEFSSAPPAPPSKYGGVVGIAMQYLGTPYVWGGASPSGSTARALSMYVYAQVGISLPHNAAVQYDSVGVYVSRSDLQPGDLVFFDGLGHMGIYIGGGQFIHAPHTGDVVKISSLSESWYASAYVGAEARHLSRPASAESARADPAGMIHALRARQIPEGPRPSASGRRGRDDLPSFASWRWVRQLLGAAYLGGGPPS